MRATGIENQRQADEQTISSGTGLPAERACAGGMTRLHQPLSLSLEADSRSLRPMRQSLNEWLGEIGANRVSDVVLAVDEAVANAIEHAGLSRSGIVTVQGHVADNVIHLEICDHGTWQEPVANAARGRGLLIMNAVMDSVAIVHRRDNTRIVMSRHLHLG